MASGVKFLFIQKQMFAYFGVMALSGYLKQNQCETDMLIDSNLSKKDLIKKINEIEPDMIGFSMMSTKHNWFTERAEFIKSRFPHIPIVAGGIHAILYPDDLISLPFVDFVCYGEGEITSLQLLKHVKFGMPIESVSGVAYKKEGTSYKTPLDKFVDLNGFQEDRNIYYDRYDVLKNMPLKIFVSSRGCPHRCTFCANPYLQNVFRGLGRYVRKKSVENFVAEVEDVKKKYGVKSVYFADDLFVASKKWLKEFAVLYKERVGVQYICTCRADMLDEEAVRYLSDSGCHTVTFGVETGNEELRMKILKKNISNKQLLKAASILRDAGIRYQTSNMFCLPGETVENAIETIDLNIKMGTSFTMSAIFLPFPKTELTELCIKMGILKADYSFEDMPHSFITRSALSIKDKNIIELLQKVAGIAIQYPKLRGIMIFLANHIRIYFLHFIFYVVGTFLRFRDERKMNIIDTLRYIWSYRKSV